MSTAEQKNLQNQIKDLEGQVDQHAQPTKKVKKWHRISSTQHAIYEDAFREGIGQTSSLDTNAGYIRIVPTSLDTSYAEAPIVVYSRR